MDGEHIEIGGGGWMDEDGMASHDMTESVNANKEID
jgi:hypothetical protein